ncbi:MAG: DUF1295 domain-containing protein [Myxococcales bacterium]|nr:DUF1295 domain-containing protein [Myxococcales bacterium]
MQGETKVSWDLPTSQQLCLGAYIVAFGVAWLVAHYVPTESGLWKAIWADVAATCVIFFASMWVNNSSMYDPYWSVAPVPIAVYWYIVYAPAGVERLRVLLMMLGVVFWSVRLTMNWLTSWWGLGHEDWRYRQLQDQTGALWWVVSFLGIHMFPTILVLLGCLPIWEVMTTQGRPFGWLDVFATLVTGGAIAIEMTSDLQLRRFMRERKPGELMRRGLWAYSRHPNYFGEIMFWCGLYLFGLAANPTWNVTSAGPISMIVLFVLISIPLMEKKILKTRPQYRQIQQEVSMLIPLPPKSSSPKAS